MRALLVLFAAWLLSLGLARAAPLIPGLGQADAVYGDGEAVYVARGAAVYRVSPGQAPVLEEIPGWGEHRTAWKGAGDIRADREGFGYLVKAKIRPDAEV